MEYETNQNTRKGIVRALDKGKGRLLGDLETESGDLYALVQLGKLVIAGGVANVGLLPYWDKVAQVETWEDPAQGWAETFEVY